jgi:aspartokinase/homoserine dehydrogenase 1
MPTTRRRAPHVHKFGGASLADPAAIRHAVSIIAEHAPAPTVVVVSAMAGVTDQLLTLAREAAAGDLAAVTRHADALEARYASAARALLPAGPRKAFLQRLRDDAAELRALATGLALVRELTPRSSDALAARGERWSARLLAAALDAAGLRGAYVDAATLIPTDGTFGGAAPDFAGTDRLAPKQLRPLLAAKRIPVVPGFIGGAPDGQTATLGRGGSDLTATLLARALGAERVSLWKDVPGFLTADPRVVPDARVLPQLHVREAAELAYYGAKVLHPRALVPLAGRGIPLFVRPFADPRAPGTEVSERAGASEYPVRALSAATEQALVTVEGSGMLGVPGIAARTFGALQARGISVALISQASSEHSICFSVPDAQAVKAQRALAHEFHAEIARREIDGIAVRRDVATVAVVGLGMAGTVGVAAGTFSALASGGINVIAIAQGSSELNISVVVDGAQAAEAQRRVHAAFQLSRIGGGVVTTPGRVDVVLLGYGQIGRMLGHLISGLQRPGLDLRVVGVVDRSGYVFDARGLSARRLAALAAQKVRGARLAAAPGGRAAAPLDAVREIGRRALARPILVDLTADDTSAELLAGLEAGMDLVLANKRPLAGPRAEAERLHAAVARFGRRLRHETTVGAGLPVIDTWYKLVDSGDTVLRIEGCLSGTLGYLLAEMGRGRRFSEAVRAAMAAGYTEPDPRDDLAGLDVGRKALILARLLGYRGELPLPKIESLVPASARGLARERFLASLEEFDGEWDRRIAQAAARGKVLRYVAEVTPRALKVGLREVDPASPFAALKGADNTVVFTTERYRTNPLVITGPGAGPAVTAAGVLNDVLSLAGIA